MAFEFEYSSTAAKTRSTACAVAQDRHRATCCCRRRFAIFGFQPYFTAGGGRLLTSSIGTRRETGFAPNTGGGVKISLAGPLRLRVDYRVFKLSGSALYSPSHRFYAGLNLKF